MLTATASFSVVNILVKQLDYIPVHEIVFFRSAISLVLTSVMIFWLGIPFFGNNKRWLLVRGLFGATALTLFFFTIKGLPLATATTLQYLSPAFTVIFAIYIMGEKMRKIQWLFFAIAFTGVLLMKGLDSSISLEFMLIGLLSAACSGLAYNGIMKCRHTDHPLTVVLYFPLVATPVMGIWSALHWVSPQIQHWPAIILIGIFTQIAQYCMTKALNLEQASKVTPLKYLGAIYASIAGWFLFDESLSWAAVIGMLLIISGLLLNSLTKFNKTGIKAI
jgi:drug/metabolite transporter (DMT)-like permease